MERLPLLVLGEFGWQNEQKYSQGIVMYLIKVCEGPIVVNTDNFIE